MIYTLGDTFLCCGKLISIDRKDQHIKDQDDIIYEVIRISNSKPLFLDDHLARFLGAFQLNTQKENQYKLLLSKYIKELIEANNLIIGNIRFQFNNNQFHKFCAWFIPFSYPTSEQYNKGVVVKTYPGERNDPNIKSRDMGLRSDADRFIAQKKIYEAILLNSENEITEGSRSNIFFIADKQIITPPLEMVLPGITRLKIISLIKEHGISFEERTIHIDEIANYTSCFITGTSPKILPVIKLNELSLDIKNPLLQKLIQLYDKAINDYLTHFKWN